MMNHDARFEPLEVDEAQGQLRDPRGRAVLLRGLNTGGRSKWSPFLPFEIDEDASLEQVRARAEVYFERIGAWGLNFARLQMSWEAVEPTQGRYDKRYLARLGALLDAAASHHIYVILDFHQDLFAAPLMGDGFPRWALPDGIDRSARPEHRAWFLAYLLDARVKRAFGRLWRDEGGLKQALMQMWVTVLEALGHHRALLGIELINEPGLGDDDQGIEAFKAQTLLPFYEALIKRLHARWPRLLISYGMPGVELFGISARTPRPAGYPLALAPHLYDPSLLLTRSGGMSMPPERAISMMGKWQRESGTPVILGEFGVTAGAREGLVWLERVMRALDTHRIHAAMWECSESATLWNGEDLNVLDASLKPRPALKALIRPWLRATSGLVADFAWDMHTQEIYLRWQSNGQDTQLSIAGLHGLEHVELLGKQARWSVDPHQRTLDLWAPRGHRVSALIKGAAP